MSCKPWLVGLVLVLGVWAGCSTDCIRHSDCRVGLMCGPQARCVVADAGTVDLADGDGGVADAGDGDGSEGTSADLAPDDGSTHD